MKTEELLEKIAESNKLNETERKFEKICKDTLYNFKTLQTQYVDDKDFHDIPVWTIRELMKKAYELGKMDALKEK